MIFVIPAGSAAELQLGLKDSFERLREETGEIPAARLVALLFAPAGAPLSQVQVIPRLGQFHWRSRYAMDLFCAGYGREGGDTHLDETFYSVAPQGPGGEWLFSDRAFDDVRRFVQEQSGWRYSGEVDLLLATARYDADAWDAKVDFAQAVELKLARAIKDEAVESVGVFLEAVFDYAEQHPDAPSAIFFAAGQTGKSFAAALIDMVLGALPVDVRPLWKKGRHLRPIIGGP